MVQKRAKKHAATSNLYEAAIEDALEAAANKIASRNYADHYHAACSFATGASIILRQTITRRESQRARSFFQWSFGKFADMGVLLTPNFHTTIHIVDEWIELFSSVYGWWAYAFERMNGVVGSTNINGHRGGEIEATMLRAWVKTMCMQDLVSQDCIPCNCSLILC